MRSLALYADGKPLPLAVERAEPLACDPACRCCQLRTPKVRSPCLPGDGEPGGLLVVGEAPGRNEDAIGRCFVGASGQLLRRALAEHWRGPVALDNACRCAPGDAEVRPKMVDACRGYLAATLAEAKPTRVVCLGATAAYAVTGRSVAPLGTRRGYTFTSAGVPVFFVVHPAAALRNRFVLGFFEADLRWALTTEPDVPDWGGRVHVVETEADARGAVAAIRAALWAAFDVETAGEMWSARCRFEIISVAVVLLGSGDAYVWGREGLRNESARVLLLDWLCDATAPKVGANVKYDVLSCLAAWGANVRGVVGDTRLWRKLLEPEASARLEDMAELVGMGGMKGGSLAAVRRAVANVARGLARSVPFGELQPGLDAGTEHAIRSGVPPAAYGFKLLPEEMLAVHNARDSVATVRLGALLSAQLSAEPELARVWHETVADASLALVRVEAWGVPVDRTALRAFQGYLETRVAAARAALAQYPGVNWASQPQVARLLYTTLGLPVLQCSDKTGAPSTCAEVLEALRKRHPLPGALLDLRFVQKLKGTYADGLMEHVGSDDRIHPHILLDGARSGRTSCQSPNLQNVPRADTPEGKMARDCFAAAPGRVLIELDFSQLELRVAAMLSGDPLMRAIFEEHVDYHQRTAELIAREAWGIDPGQVEKKHRSQAKGVNFGLLYGMSDAALAATLGVSQERAARVREAVLGRFRVLAQWCQERLRETRISGVAWTWWDGARCRRRSMWRIADRDGEARSRAENGSYNSPVQGTASDFCVRSLTECVRWVEDDGLDGDVMLVLAVHDSLLFDARADLAREVVCVAREIMTGWPSAGVPLEVDAKVGRAWGSLEPWKENAA